MKRNSTSSLSILEGGGVDDDRDRVDSQPLVKSWKAPLRNAKAYRLAARNSKWTVGICALIGLYGLSALLSYATSETQRFIETKREAPAERKSVEFERHDETSAKKIQDVQIMQPWPPNDRLRALPLHTPLEDRLRSLTGIPVKDPPDWLEWNFHTCPPHRIRKNQADGYRDISHKFWDNVNSTSITSYRNDMITFLSEELYSETGRLNFLTKRRERKLANMWGWKESEEEKELKKTIYGEGRGLVYAAGNSDTVNRAITSLKLLRRMANVSVEALPAEVFMYEEERASLSDCARLQLAELGATLRTVSNSSIAKGTDKGVKNYQIKATAIIQSSFKEVLYLDSDNLPASASFAEIFESPGYKRLGALFWPDYWKSMAQNPVWQLIGIQCRDEWEIEAGQLLIDKEKHLDALLLTEAMLKNHATWFFFSDGDKETFRFAFLALRKRWAVPAKFVSPAGSVTSVFTNTRQHCGHTMVHFDHLGRPFTVHQNILKQYKDRDRDAVRQGGIWDRYVTMKDDLPAHPPINATEEALTFVEGDLDCDMLANANFDGVALAPAPRSVRLRAAYERGLKPGWHGGWGGEPLCIELKWEDPRFWGGNEFNTWPDQDTSRNPLGILWKNPLNETWWKDDDRLRDFESTFFKVGGEPFGWSIDE